MAEKHEDSKLWLVCWWCEGVAPALEVVVAQDKETAIGRVMSGKQIVHSSPLHVQARPF